jgi:FkbM family methyltransferase
MACHGGFSLDEATRRSWYNPEAILQDLRLGMTVMDIGCGDGFFTILAAKKVGEKGHVYALDVDHLAIEKLQSKAKAEGLNNITATVGKAEGTVFCKQCADFILYSMNLHDFDDAAKVLQNARQMIKPDGIVVDLDWKKIELPHGPPLAIKFSEEYVAELMRSAGFAVTEKRDVGRYHYVVVAKPS